MTTAEKLAQLDAHSARVLRCGGPKAVEKQHALGKRTARERIELLMDTGTFTEVDRFVRHRCTSFGMGDIVPMCSHIDHTEHDVQVIVTEQGLADLRWKSPRQRAELIVERCAHPQYRPLLREYLKDAAKYGGHTPHNLQQALSWHTRYLDRATRTFGSSGKAPREV